jgi:hypothetical protein
MGELTETSEIVVKDGEPKSFFLKRCGVKPNDSKQRGDGQNCQAEVVEIFIPVLKRDRREWLGCIESMRDIVVGYVKVDGFVKIVHSGGGILFGILRCRPRGCHRLRHPCRPRIMKERTGTLVVGNT